MQPEIRPETRPAVSRVVDTDIGSAIRFDELQRRMVRICLGGAAPDTLPETQPERVAVYRELVRTTIEDSLARAYPIAKAVLAEDWDKLVDAFIAGASYSHPELWRMPSHLLEFEGLSDFSRARPWLTDLLRFEWVEIEVYMMEDRDAGAVDPAGDPIRGVPVVNDEHRVLELRYPVFRGDALAAVSRGETVAASPSLLLVYRHPDSRIARFFAIGEEHLILLSQLDGRETTGTAAVARLVGSRPEHQSLSLALTDFLRAAAAERLLLGTRRP